MPDQAWLECAVAAARAGSEVHRRHLGRVRPSEWSEKAAMDFVTHVDHEAEQCILTQIRARFPEHAVLAEEATTAAARAGARPTEPAAAEWLWVVDPLDGTTNFLHGYPMYAVSIALLHRGVPVAAAVRATPSNEEWTALAGRGAHKDGQPIRVSAIDRLDQALIGTGFPFRDIERLDEYLAQFAAVTRHVSGIRRAGSAAVDLCHVACGYLDGFWEQVLAPWDIAAGTLIIREAGGVVTRLDGHTDPLADLDPAGSSVLAGNPAMHAALGIVVRSE